jgi:hypothetical protein
MLQNKSLDTHRSWDEQRLRLMCKRSYEGSRIEGKAQTDNSTIQQEHDTIQQEKYHSNRVQPSCSVRDLAPNISLSHAC